MVASEVCKDESRERRALSIVKELRKLLAQCKGIEVEDADLRTKAEITLDDYSHLTRWDFDYMSAGDEKPKV